MDQRVFARGPAPNPRNPNWCLHSGWGKGWGGPADVDGHLWSYVDVGNAIPG
jgi:hypothetical protein